MYDFFPTKKCKYKKTKIKNEKIKMKKSKITQGENINKKGSNILSLIGFIVLFLLGAGVLFYPRISFWLADYNHTVAHQGYERSVGELTKEQRKEIWDAAVNYNRKLVKSMVRDPFAEIDELDPFDEYYQTLDIGDGVMGYVHIPKLDIMLPIYHGVTDEVLDKGVGHIKATALPVGGEDTHCVLTGHTALSHDKMFDDLINMQIGDKFFLEIIDETLAYQVRQIEVVLPDDISMLKREVGKDLVTLLTCTPYGVNSHRLLVIGERIPFVEPMPIPQKVDKTAFPWWIVTVVISGLLLVVIFGKLINKRAKANKGYHAS